MSLNLTDSAAKILADGRLSSADDRNLKHIQSQSLLSDVDTSGSRWLVKMHGVAAVNVSQSASGMLGGTDAAMYKEAGNEFACSCR